MRPLLLLLCLAAVATAAEDRVFLETSAPRESVYIGESFVATLLIGVDLDFFESNAVPLFRRRMDVDLKVVAPGWEVAAGEGRRLSLAFNDEVVELLRAEDRVVGDRTFAVVLARRTCRPERPGDFTLPAPVLRYAWSKEFREDFISGRVPVERLDEEVRGAPLTVRVLPLPEEGRPASFTGAVGRFTVSAEAAPTDVVLGESLKLTMVVRGEGDLARFGTPRLDALSGFNVYGAIEERDADRRTITWDLAPTAGGIREIPAIPFAFFDPGAAAFEIVSTKPIPLTVSGEAPTSDEGGPGAWIYAVAAAAAVGAVLLAGARRRVRARAESDTGPSPREVFEAALDRPDPDVAAAFTDYLATILAVPPAAVIGPDLAPRLTAAGIPHDLARRAADLLEALVGARYGGDTETGLDAVVRSAVVEISRAVPAASCRTAPGDRPGPR